MTRPMGCQWDMVILGKTVHIVYAETADEARLEIASKTQGIVGYSEDYRIWAADAMPVRQMGSQVVQRRRWRDG